jgi:hypothetical protein
MECVEKKIHHNLKSCISKYHLWEWCLSPIQTPRFWLCRNSESLFNEALSTPCFWCKKFAQHGCICPPKPQCLKSDHNPQTCHCILLHFDT